ncbi:MAG: hypothetical protein Q9195_000215 [Heterodermia aff. obscurata]
MAAYERIFAAVFPPSADAVVPTPAATPVLGSSGLGQSFGGFVVPEPEPQNSAEEQIKWDRSWHTATSYLSLPDELITIAHAKQSQDALKARWLKPFRAETANAVSYIVSNESQGRKLRKGSMKDNLLQWYFEEVVSRHYVYYVLPTVTKSLNDNLDQRGLSDTIQVLQVAQAIYSHPLKNHISSFLAQNGAWELEQARQSLHSLFTHSIPTESFTVHVSQFLKEQASIVLCVNEALDQPLDSAIIAGARRNTIRVMESLKNIGLAGPKVERLFAEVMNGILDQFVAIQFAGKWNSPSKIPEQLRDWIENRFSRFIVEVLAHVRDANLDSGKFSHSISYGDTLKWQQMGIRKLGELRVEELFEVIAEWSLDSQGAIEDLKYYVREGKWRFHLTSMFCDALSRRLLQPGASTTEILQMYMAIIRAFTILDPKGVLLDRVARPIRRYLREREDTVNIVVGGLLADLEDDPPVSGVLYELAEELETTGGLPVDEKVEDLDDLDFDDMMWEPDPVDAPLEYKRSKHNDVIGALISLFETKEAFIKEFEKILGERLLRNEHELDKEIRVKELLKIRFGEPPLQSCEVMLRDIQDSRRVDAFIHKEQNFAQNQRLHAKILSHHFWPSLHTDEFHLPAPITSLQTRYADSFSKLKASRKLTWHPSLGQVTVSLGFDDRVIREEVQTWQASVIYAFDSTSSPKTVQELASALDMSDPLVRNALTFWVSKFVLVQSAPDTYRVLERLPSDSAHSSSTTAQAAAAAAASEAVNSAAASSAVKSEGEMLQEKMQVYWNFVKAMLTNQGAMPLDKIVLMLKMVVPGGFPFGVEELKGFLGGMVEEGRLEVGLQGYKIVH